MECFREHEGWFKFFIGKDTNKNIFSLSWRELQ